MRTTAIRAGQRRRDTNGREFDVVRKVSGVWEISFDGSCLELREVDGMPGLFRDPSDRLFCLNRVAVVTAGQNTREHFRTEINLRDTELLIDVDPNMPYQPTREERVEALARALLPATLIHSSLEAAVLLAAGRNPHDVGSITSETNASFAYDAFELAEAFEVEAEERRNDAFEKAAAFEVEAEKRRNAPKE